MKGVVFTPFFFGAPAAEIKLAGQAGTSQLWRKKVLPVGDVEYKGRMLRFTPDYLAQLVESFDANAYDQVPFQLADAKNTHTNDPERYRGSVVRLELAPDGLYALARVTPEGERLLLQNPSLGVSARIVEDYQRSDGTYYPAAIQHVLGTLDPRIPQLGPWQQVDMSNDGGSVLDLTNLAFAGDQPDGEYDDNSAAMALRQLAYAHDGHPAGVHLHRAASAVEAGEDPAEHIAAALDAWGDHEAADGLREPAGAAFATPSEIAMANQAAADAWEDAGARGVALELATALAARGDIAGAMEAREFAAGGGDVLGLAGLQEMNHAIELSVQREQVRLAEDASRDPQAGTEDRLAAAYARIQRGTYVPRDFAGPALMDGVYGSATCGQADDLGYCTSVLHEAGCGGHADTALAEVLIEEGVYDAVTADGQLGGWIWHDQHGQEMTLTGLVEAATGERLGDGVTFESGYGPRELRMPQRHLTYDAEDGQGPVGFQPATMATMLQLRDQMGEPRKQTAAEEGMANVMARGDLAGPHYQRLQHPDFSGQPTMAERAELGKREFGLAAVDEVLPGALPQFTYGSI